jgi:hypothetical protein
MILKISFNFFGHPNILSNHFNTIEFTKDTELSKKGDCILGVNSDFDSSKLKELVKKYQKVKISIHAGKFKDEIIASTNKDFKDLHELVIRKSDYLSNRTFAIKADKAAKDINRDVVYYLKKADTKGIVEIEGIV